MHVSIQIPIYQYDNFVKAINPFSRAADILKHADYHREIKNGRFERTMKLSCTPDELKMLRQLATQHCPEVAPFFWQASPRRKLPKIVNQIAGACCSTNILEFKSIFDRSRLRPQTNKTASAKAIPIPSTSLLFANSATAVVAFFESDFSG